MANGVKYKENRFVIPSLSPYLTRYDDRAARENHIILLFNIKCSGKLR